MPNIPNSCWPETDVLVGGQPTKDDFVNAKDAGFKTVINVRGLGEEGTDWEPPFLAELGLQYRHIPVAGPMDITKDKASLLRQTMEDSERPILIHCASGNRVGALFAVHAFETLGLTQDQALQIGCDAGLTKLKPFVEGLLR